MSELDETTEGPVRDRSEAPPGAAAGPDVAGGDAGGEVARRIRAVLRHGLDGDDAEEE